MSIRTDFLPELSAGFNALTSAALADSSRVAFKLADYGGFRTQSDTTEILAYRTQDYQVYAAAEQSAGRTPLPMSTWRPIQPYGSSMHDFGAAFDVEPISIGGIDIHQTPTRAGIWRTDPRRAQALLDQATNALDNLASSAGLRSGVSFNDPLHFELPVSLVSAQAMWGNYQDTGSSTGTGDVTSGGDIAGGDDDTQQTTRSSSGAAAIEILGAIALAGVAVLIVRAIRG